MRFGVHLGVASPERVNGELRPGMLVMSKESI